MKRFVLSVLVLSLVWSATAVASEPGVTFDRDGDGREDPMLLTLPPCDTGAPNAFHWATASGYVDDSFGMGCAGARLSADFDGDRRADPVRVTVATDGNFGWSSKFAGPGGLGVSFGRPPDQPFVGDVDGDGRADLIVVREGPPGFDTEWFVWLSPPRGPYVGPLRWGNGSFDDWPVPADYDGDGITDIAVARRATILAPYVEWYIAPSSGDRTRLPRSGQTNLVAFFGRPGSTLVPGNYLGDEGAELAVIDDLPNGVMRWYVHDRFTAESAFIADFGEWATDVPVPADYDGDGLTDIAVWRAPDGENGTFFIRNSSDGSVRTLVYGVGGRDVVPNDGTVFPTEE